jgi:ribosomal protein S18 acetylase RimI-like enzyme
MSPDPDPDVTVAHHVPDGCLDDVVRLLRSTGWAADRERDGVRRMLAHTDVVVCLLVDRPSGPEAVGFARALTDHEYRAFVEDVVVGVPYRGRGLGSRLVEALCTHPDLADVDRIALECRADLVDFYRPFGFEPVPDRARLLIRERSADGA